MNYIMNLFLNLSQNMSKMIPIFPVQTYLIGTLWWIMKIFTVKKWKKGTLSKLQINSDSKKWSWDLNSLDSEFYIMEAIIPFETLEPATSPSPIFIKYYTFNIFLLSELLLNEPAQYSVHLLLSNIYSIYFYEVSFC